MGLLVVDPHSGGRFPLVVTIPFLIGILPEPLCWLELPVIVYLPLSTSLFPLTSTPLERAPVFFSRLSPRFENRFLIDHPFPLFRNFIREDVVFPFFFSPLWKDLAGPSPPSGLPPVHKARHFFFLVKPCEEEPCAPSSSSRGRFLFWNRRPLYLFPQVGFPLVW